MLVVVNYSDAQGNGSIVLDDLLPPPANPQTVIRLTEIMSGEEYERKIEDLRTAGLFCAVEPWAVQVFEF